jgi:amino acid transporter
VPVAEKMRWNATFTMAVGGMVGGGIFSVLGVVVALAGSLAWAAFVLAGAVALVTAASYVALARRYGDGGAFAYLRETGRHHAAGLLSWLLVAGYVLTVGVYAYTFGHYLAALLGGGPVLERVLAVGIVAALVGVNVAGVSESAWVEIVAVWSKLAVLAALAAVGLARWEPRRLGPSHGVSGVAVGAAAIFVAYQGFELLTYDYDDIERPKRTLPRALLPAVGTTMLVYVAVGVAAAMLVGARGLVARQDVALAVAGQAAFGAAGRVAVSVAAGLSAASAINATLFSTARLCCRIQEYGELPSLFARTEEAAVPARGVIVLGAAGAALAAVGTLSSLVEAASLTFLVTFAIVNVIATRRLDRARWLAVLGALAAAGAAVTVGVRLAGKEPAALVALLAFTAVATVGRLLSHVSR